MSKQYNVAFLALGLASCVLFVGCTGTENEQAANGDRSPVAEKEDDYDPHDVPLTDEQKTELRQETAEYPQAINMIRSLRDSVQQETEAGIPESPFKVHQSLDKADLVLQWLPEIARDSAVAKEHWEQINTTANAMRTLFEQVHQNIDNKQDPNFSDVADGLDQQLSALEEIVTARK